MHLSTSCHVWKQQGLSKCLSQSKMFLLFQMKQFLGWEELYRGYIHPFGVCFATGDMAATSGEVPGSIIPTLRDEVLNFATQYTSKRGQNLWNSSHNQYKLHSEEETLCSLGGL